MQEAVKNDIKKRLIKVTQIMYAKDISEVTTEQLYEAFSVVIRDYLSKRWIETNNYYKEHRVKQVYYLSMEFLIGRLLESNLLNLGIKQESEQALKELGLDIDKLIEEEPDPGLGNGGLGRLAACFIDSMASLGIPGHGCGIRYKYGLFKQKIENGEQVEMADRWLGKTYPWEVRKRNRTVSVKFGGKAHLENIGNKLKVVYSDYYTVKAVPYDVPIAGANNGLVNTLRLWSAKACDDDFDFKNFNSGQYMQAVEGKYTAELISHVLYPNDSTESGKLLRLKQEYFFVSASIQSILNYHEEKGINFKELDEYVAFHINDTHPALAVAELMRILIDEKNFKWEDAWELTRRTCAYTNHTILQEALEKWDVNLFKNLLPRIYLIIEEIDRRFTQEVMCKYENQTKVNNMGIIADGVVKMAHLSIVGSHSVNGVAALHTEILKNKELKEFHDFFKGKFNNKTNGITHRRWLLKCNPELSKLLDETIGTSYQKDTLKMNDLLAYQRDDYVLDMLIKVKAKKKSALADYIKCQNGEEVDINSIFDVQVKRIHGYKRQLMNCFHIMYLYNKLKSSSDFDCYPRTFIFSAKAAPTYYLAKEIIKLINTLARIINNDPDVNKKLKVVFISDYSVSKAEVIIPGADVSEQISTAGKEASGTGNMKFMMNGAITVATLDGANVEIKELVGEENIIIFGMDSEEVHKLNKSKEYNVHHFLSENDEIKNIVAMLEDGQIGKDIFEFREIKKYLYEENDYYYVLKDLPDYIRAQKKVEDLYRDKKRWAQMMLVNIAKSGHFSSDLTIARYAKEIWRTPKVTID